MSRWVKKNKLNVNKTQILFLVRKRRVQELTLEQMDVRLEGQTLSRDSNVKYLGVWVDDKLMWQTTLQA